MTIERRRDHRRRMHPSRAGRRRRIFGLGGMSTRRGRRPHRTLAAERLEGRAMLANAAPYDITLAPESDSGTVGDTITNFTQPKFKGKADSNATVEIWSSQTLLGSATTDGNGDWAFGMNEAGVFLGPDGQYAIKARASFGGSSPWGPWSNALTITLDTTKPATPTAVTLDLASDSGQNNNDGITNDTTPTLNITAADATTVKLLLTKGTSRVLTAATLVPNTTDQWTATPTTALEAGDWTPAAFAVDKAGNQSDTFTGAKLTIVSPPAKPATPDLVAADDTGISNVDNVTTMQSPTFTGPAPVGTKVELFATPTGATPTGGTAISLGKADVDAKTEKWTITSGSPLSNGSYAITVKVTDAAGSTSEASSPLTLEIDRKAPRLTGLDAGITSPTATPVTSAAVKFDEDVFFVAGNAFWLTVNPLRINLRSATATPESPTTVNDTTTNQLVSGDADWTLGNLAPLNQASGTYTLSFAATGSGIVDRAGNPVLASSLTKSWTVDTSGPTATIAVAPVATTSPRNSAVTSATITFSEEVTGVDLADFLLTRDGFNVPFGTTPPTIRGSGKTWTLTNIPGTTADGSYTLRLKASGSNIEDNLNNALALDAAAQWDMDNTAPTGVFETITTPRSSALQTIALRFNEPVRGVELGDFTLTRGGNPVQLNGVTLTPSTGPAATYLLSGLGGLTGTDGKYQLKFAPATGAAATDVADNQLAADITTPEWTVDSAVPTAAITLNPAGNPRKDAVSSAAVTFSLPVIGVGVTDFRLTRDGVDVTSFGTTATISGSGKDWTLDNLSSLTTAPGSYVLTLVAAGSEIARASAPAPPLAANAVASWTMDTSAPTVALSVTNRAVATGSTTFTVQSVFSEPVTGFAVADVTVSPSFQVSNLVPVGMDGRVYRFDVTVLSPRDPVTVSIDKDKATDAAGNGNAASAPLKLITDFTGPTVSLTSNVSAVTNQSPFTVTATFSEAVSGFGLGDITVTNGNATDLTALTGNAVYTFTITPTTDGLVGVALGPNVATDASGNGNAPSNSLAIRLDRKAPTVTLASLSSSPSRDSILRFTATFSKPVTGVEMADLTVTNGTVTAVQGSGANYTFLVAPTADGDVKASMAAGKATDEAGNANTAAPAAVTVRSDRTPPTVKVSAPVNGVATITFSEKVNGFDMADMRLFRNGAAVPPTGVSLALKTGSDCIYELSGLGNAIAPEGQYSLQLIAAGSGIVDEAGNQLLVTTANVANTSVIFTVDTTSPVAGLSIGSPLVRVAADKATVSFSEAVTGVNLTDFELRRNGAVVPLTGTGVSLTPAAGPAATYSLSGLAAVANTEAAYSLRLRALGSGITDGSGNPLRIDAVGNWVVDVTAPTATVGPVAPSIRTTPVSTVPIAFSEPVVGLDVGDFTLRRNGVVVQLTGATLSPVGTGGRDYVLGGLGGLTRTNGGYELRMRTANTGIADRAGNPLSAEAFAGWANAAAPSPGTVTASFLPVSPNPRTTPVETVTVAFSLPVAGVDATDFVLTRTAGGVTTPVGGFTVTGSGSQRVITGLNTLTAAPGAYALRLRATGSGIATGAGVALKTDALATWATLASTNQAPTATLFAETPAQTGTAVDSVAIAFSEPVTGMTLAALRLTRNGVPLSLNGAVLTGSGAGYVLSGLAPITAASATYGLTLVAAGSSVRDSEGVGMAVDASTGWTVTTSTLRAAFLGVDTIRTAPVAGIQVRFSSLVKGVDLRDFELQLDGESVPLFGVTVTGSGSSWVIGNLAPVQARKGTYTLRLTKANGDIMTGAGPTLAEDAVVTWTII